jgi:hypothetical protein
MNHWLALSDHHEALAHAAQTGPLLARGTLVFDVELPLAGAAVMLDFKANDNWPRALSLFVDDAAGVAILHRQGHQICAIFCQGR